MRERGNRKRSGLAALAKKEGASVFNLKIPLMLLGFALFLIALFSFKINSFEPPFITILNWDYIMAKGIIIGMAFLLLVFYSTIRKSDILKDDRLKWFLGGLVIIIVLFGKVTPLLSPFLVPVALAVGLATVFLGKEVGFILNVFLALLVAMEEGVTPYGAVVAFGGGMTALFGMLNLRKGSDIAITGIGIAIVNMILTFGVLLFLGGPSAIRWSPLSWAGTSGLGSALLLMAGIPIAEYVTEKTSPIGLMELLNPSHPLLTRLEEEAPGTYEHSMAVAKLAARAARVIGANPLLSEVGGYYHDIGKLGKPQYFIENQGNRENPHDQVSPHMSKMIITSHIKEGIKLGQEYGLKKDVLRFIPEHHGKSIMRYFYLKALRKEHKESEISPEQFRYEAVPPRSKETSILMLADSVEATARAEGDSRVEEIIDEVFQDKIEDGQLDDSPLTLAELHRIREAFIEALRAKSHPRVEDYPSSFEVNEEEERKSKPRSG